MSIISSIRNRLFEAKLDAWETGIEMNAEGQRTDFLTVPLYTLRYFVVDVVQDLLLFCRDVLILTLVLLLAALAFFLMVFGPLVLVTSPSMAIVGLAFSVAGGAILFLMLYALHQFFALRPAYFSLR